MKKIVILVLALIIIPVKVKANCSNEELIRLQKIANNINTNYEYDEITNSFKITFANVTDEVIITDINRNYDYISYGELQISNLSSGMHTYYIYARNKSCYENELNIKTLQLPYYNQYYNNDKCANMRNSKYCSKWLPNSITYNTWITNVTKYKESIKEEKKETKTDNKKTMSEIVKELIEDLYVNYYYVFLPIIILALCAIIYLKNKSDQLI